LRKRRARLARGQASDEDTEASNEVEDANVPPDPEVPAVSPPGNNCIISHESPKSATGDESAKSGTSGKALPPPAESEQSCEGDTTAQGNTSTTNPPNDTNGSPKTTTQSPPANSQSGHQKVNPDDNNASETDQSAQGIICRNSHSEPGSSSSDDSSNSSSPKLHVST
jgi:hypothetical protein